MRSVGVLAVLLLLMACKPMARGPVSGLEAIGDDNLTLGMVPVENNSGIRAYRLLICRKSASYPKWMLEDSNRCRPALLDQDSSEVVFLQDDLERDFATKYAGYGKGFILPALIGAGAATIGVSVTTKVVGGGKKLVEEWVIGKGFAKAKDGWVWVKNIFDNVSGKVLSIVPDRFKNIPVGTAGIVKYRVTYETSLRQLQVAQTTNKALPKQLGVTLQGMEATVREQGSIYASALNLRSLEIEQSALRQFDSMSPEEQAKHVESLTATNKQIADNNDKMFFATMANWDKTVATGKNEFTNMDGFNDYIHKLPSRNEHDRNKFIIDNMDKSEEITARINSIDGEIIAARQDLQKAKNNREHTVIAGLPVNKARWGAVGGVVAATGLGATVAGTATDTITSATQTLIDLDRSLWGYADRQTSMYWSQVFREGDMQDARQVQDLRAILGAFAEVFGHKVNEDAFALGG